MNELYTLVPGDLRLPPPMGLGCDDNDFCPLATRMHNQAPTQHRWADPLPENVIRDTPGRSSRSSPLSSGEPPARTARDSTVSAEHFECGLIQGRNACCRRGPGRATGDCLRGLPAQRLRDHPEQEDETDQCRRHPDEPEGVGLPERLGRAGAPATA
jgi:hypothetical protein